MILLSFRAVATSALSLLLAGVVIAQQPAPRRRTPTLTTEDVLRDRAQPATEVEGEAKPATGGATSPAPAKPLEDKASPEETAWRENVANARHRAKETERAAEEAELRITDLRNRLASSGQTTRERNQTAAELDVAGQRLLELRKQERAAADDLQKLLEHGREKRFTEAPEPTPEGGTSGEDFYRQQYAKLTEKVQTAQRRVQLYENRLRDVNQRMQTNAVSGDNFYLAQLRQERDDAQNKLSEAQAAREQALADVDQLKQEARRAGVPPGVFR